MFVVTCKYDGLNAMDWPSPKLLYLYIYRCQHPHRFCWQIFSARYALVAAHATCRRFSNFGVTLA